MSHEWELHLQSLSIPALPRLPLVLLLSSAAVAVAIHVYTEQLADVTLYNNLRAALTSEILTAANASFLSALEILISVLAISHHLLC
jgi:hypothetical protein